jgi:signal transduction histidine kinase
MKARFDERLAERTRIARDPHDTLLQTIQGSKLVADDALSASADLSHMRQAMEKLSPWLGRATEKGRASCGAGGVRRITILGKLRCPRPTKADAQ